MDQPKPAYAAALRLYTVLKRMYGVDVLMFKRVGIPTISLENPYASLTVKGNSVRVKDNGKDLGVVWTNTDKRIKIETVGEGMLGFFA